MEPPAPEPTPEGALIRYWRELAGMSVDEAVAALRAAAASRGASASISPGYWRSVEKNRGSTRGRTVPVRASDVTLARMASVIPGVTPARLASEGARPEAAKMLAELLRQQEQPRPAAVQPDVEWLPALQADPGQIGPLEAEVRAVVAAVRRHKPAARGSDFFTDEREVAAWDAFSFPGEDDEAVRAVARLRMRQRRRAQAPRRASGLPRTKFAAP